MIDSLSFLVLTLLSVCLSQIFIAKNAAHRLFWAVVPGFVLLYAVHPIALLYAIGCLFSSVTIYAIGKLCASAHIKTRLPYLMFLLLFLPDIFKQSESQPILFLGAAFFVIRNMITLAEALKKNISIEQFIPSLLLATFFFAALPSGPIYNGLDVWKQLKEKHSVNLKEGSYRLFEGFVCLFALAGLTSLGIEFLNSLNILFGNAFSAIAYSFFYIALNSLLSFAFLFTTFYGYSRIAEGTALLMGFSVPTKF